MRGIGQLDPSQPDPAHMLYVRLGVPVYLAWRTAGFGSDPLRPMQVLNAAFGMGAIVLFALILSYGTGQRWIVLLASIAAGFSYTYWTHTVDAFFIIPASFFALLALFCALTSTAARPGLRLAWLMGAGFSLGGAALAYQANLAVLPAVWLASARWPLSRQSVKPWLWSCLLIGVVAAGVSGSAWVYQGIHAADVHSVQAFIDWFLTSHGGMRNPMWRREGVNLLTTIPLALVGSVVPVYRGLHLRELLHGNVTPDRLPGQLGLAVFVLTLAYVLTVACLRRSRILADGQRQHSLCVWAVWFAVPGVAVAWFDPAETKLWLIPLFGVWGVIAIILGDAARARTVQLRGTSLVLSALLAAFVPLGTLVVAVWPDHQSAAELFDAAHIAMAHMHKGDLVVTATWDWPLYMEYLSDEYQVVDALHVAQSEGNDAVKPTVMGMMNETWQQGGHVYVLDYFKPQDAIVWQAWITPLTHLIPADFDAYQRRFAWQANDQTVWELLPP
jgi:4-amino-4-deoxy-L-arabinose transferase-like glycosyltransferase